MKKISKSSLQGLLLVPALMLGLGAVVPVLVPATAGAAELGKICDPDAGGAGGGAKCVQSDDQPTDLFGNGGIFTKIVNALLFLIGAIAVIMLVYGGIRYATSGGDASAVTAAKNTILYAIVGIVVAILAYAIVNFVVTQLT